MVTAGIHRGSIAGGVIGVERLIYDTFGDTVNTASRVMSTAIREAGGIFVSTDCLADTSRPTDGASTDVLRVAPNDDDDDGAAAETVILQVRVIERAAKGKGLLGMHRLVGCGVLPGGEDDRR